MEKVPVVLFFSVSNKMVEVIDSFVSHLYVRVTALLFTAASASDVNAMVGKTVLTSFSSSVK